MYVCIMCINRLTTYILSIYHTYLLSLVSFSPPPFLSFFLRCFYHTFMQLCRFPYPLLLMFCVQYITIDKYWPRAQTPTYQSTYICDYLAGQCMHQYPDPRSRPYVYVPTPPHILPSSPIFPALWIVAFTRKVQVGGASYGRSINSCIHLA